MPARRPGGGASRIKRKHSLGNLRRAHPASGATWNVQVVRGKMSSKCLWHACRALILGLTLMLLGAGMATLGYYSDQLMINAELHSNVSNSAVRVKNDLKGFHLNNFSYVGPIVMGFGGFIVVASCVMTFEARDSAAKVVPARLRASGGSKTTVRSNQSSSASQRRANDIQHQATRWDQHFGVFRSSPADPPQPPPPLDRDALTAELIKFSKSLSGGRQLKSRGAHMSNSLVQRSTRESVANCILLQPPKSKRLYWHASSFDETGRVMGDKPTVHRSDTAKRHVLARQKPIEHEEDKAISPLGKRRCSTMSDSSYSGRWTVRCSSMASRTSSIDSRRIQVDLHSPEVLPKSILRSPKPNRPAPSATSSVDKEFRSQLSVCSEPPAAIRQLSCQSSLEPCLPEEAIELLDEKPIETILPPTEFAKSAIDQTTDRLVDELVRKSSIKQKKARPDSLALNAQASVASDKRAITESQTSGGKPLVRSNSSRIYNRPKPQINKNQDDSIYFIRSQLVDNAGDHYDSLRVINERRSTLLRADSETALGERKLSSFSLVMQDIPEKVLDVSIDADEDVNQVECISSQHETILQIECLEDN